MVSLKEKLIDWKNRLKDRHMLSVIVVMMGIIIILGLIIYKKQTEYRQASENAYNMAFYELVNYVDSMETYLAKSLISNSAEQGAETLTYVWREANLAQTYLAQIPVSNEGLSNATKFLNQVSDYSYSLSRKNMSGEKLTEDDFKNLEQIHNYSVELKNILNQLSNEINSGNISWSELTKKATPVFAKQVSNMSKDSFGNIEENFHDYTGLIYDGAFSEHMTNIERKGLTGENITEEQALEIAKKFINEENIEEIISNGLSENGNIPSYSFSIKTKETDENNSKSIAISQKGGHIVYMNYNRNIETEIISEEDANKIGKRFLEEKGFQNMKETYYLKNNGILTINYAYQQEDVIIYPDLIKLKIALDDGEILGIETTGFLNCHTERNLNKIKITKEQAKEKINKNLEIIGEDLAIIPTEYQTEILCWEFKGKIEEKEFLVYINVETGKEEDILLIVNTPNGTLTT